MAKIHVQQLCGGIESDSLLSDLRKGICPLRIETSDTTDPDEFEGNDSDAERTKTGNGPSQDSV